jgi:predicted peptidase
MQKAYFSGSLKYLLHTPSDYDGKTKLPLILFLHGSGERGDDTEQIKKWGLPKELDSRPDFPFIVLSPQCPAEKRWIDLEKEVMALLEEVVGKYSVDRARIYLTGFSMGGQGAWYFAVQHPNTWAAVTPVAGRIPDEQDFLKRLCVLKSKPVWVFHGADDEAVPLSGSQVPVEALRDCGGEVRFTVYPDLGHGATADETYRNDNLYAWFFGASVSSKNIAYEFKG